MPGASGKETVRNGTNRKRIEYIEEEQWVKTVVSSNERYIIQKGKEFLMGCPYEDSDFCRWSNSPYNGWQSKSFNTAIMIVGMLGAKVVKFNRLTGNVSGGWK